MKKYLALILLTILLSGCGFHLQYEPEVPTRFKTLSYVSGDPFGRLSRNVKELLRDNEVTLTDANDKAKYPTLHIVKDSLNKNTISIYQDGKAAEYQLVLTVQAQVVIAGEQIHPIKVSIFRTFFDNPAAALAKNVEQNLIEDEMYKQAATQIIRKLKSIDATN